MQNADTSTQDIAK